MSPELPWKRTKARRDQAQVRPAAARKAGVQPGRVTNPRSAIGLDFGTTNSCVSFVNARGDLGRVKVSTGNVPYDTVLATIALDPIGDEPRVGIEAQSMRVQRPHATYMAHFKHILDSQRLRELQPVKKVVSTGEYDFVQQSERLVEAVEWVWTGGEYTREELVGGVARILERLLQRAVEAGADPEASLWVGIPTTFSSNARKRLLSALAETRTLDGEPFFPSYHELLSRVHFVLEPIAVAAAPAEELAIEGTENVLIFDHGGGTLDLSVIAYEAQPSAPPAPIKELAGGGASDVAGRHFDQAFEQVLKTDDAIRAELDQLDPYVQTEVVEALKMDLSTSDQARLRPTKIVVPRATFERAVEPLLARIEHEVLRTLSAQDLSPSDVDWLLLTGGSSLVPAVQERVMGLFPHAEEQGRVLRYFPEDTEPGRGVESAITDVAQGLALFGQQRTLEQIVLWDIELGRDNTGDFVPLFEKGATYELDEQDRPELRTLIPAPDMERDGACYGLYERQLDRRYLFGLANTPPLPEGSQLLVRLRRDSPFPALRLLDRNGRTLARKESPSGWEHDRLLCADLEELPDNQLDAFFHGDAEYLPDLGYLDFSQAPLVRRLRRGDVIEWTRHKYQGKWIERRGRGEIKEIRRHGSHERLDEMTSWDASEYTFTVRTEGGTGGTLQLESCNGSIRLAPRPGKGY